MHSSLTLTLIQTNLHWEDKTANLQMLDEKISGIREKTELVILPEMFNTGFSMKPEELAETMEGETVQWMRRVAAKKNIILTGSVIIRETVQKEQVQAEGGQGETGQTETVRPVYYNRLIWMLPNGQYGVYDKRHLFGFSGEDKQFSPGDKRLIASVNGWK